MKNKYRLYEYDVWGNEIDGYNVNNIFNTGIVYMIDHTLPDNKLIYQLKQLGCIKKGIHCKSVTISGDDEIIYFDYKGKPEFELIKEE